MEMQPGTIVKFKNLVGKPDFNGRCGVVKKQLPNGRFNILNDASEIDLSFNEKNLQIISTCPNEQRLNTEGVLIWPHVKGVNTPSMQWMNDPKLTKEFKNPYETDAIGRPAGAFKGCGIDIFTGMFDDEDREKVMKKYEDILIEKLGWNTPQMWRHQITSKGILQNKIVIYYDEDSEAPVNDWLNSRFNHSFITGIQPKIRGSFLYINQLDEKFGTVEETINHHKGIFHNLRYYERVPDYRTMDEKEHTKLSEKYCRRLLKIRTILPTCSKKCDKCDAETSIAEITYSLVVDKTCTKKEAEKAVYHAEYAKVKYDQAGVHELEAIVAILGVLDSYDEPARDYKDALELEKRLINSPTLSFWRHFGLSAKQVAIEIFADKTHMPYLENKHELKALFMIYECQIKKTPESQEAYLAFKSRVKDSIGITVNQKGEDRKARREQKRSNTLSKDKKKTDKNK